MTIDAAHGTDREDETARGQPSAEGWHPITHRKRALRVQDQGGWVSVFVVHRSRDSILATRRDLVCSRSSRASWGELKVLCVSCYLYHTSLADPYSSASCSILYRSCIDPGMANMPQ